MKKLALLIISSFLIATALDAKDINQKELTEYVKYLSSDELKGRFPGTPGIEAAAKFIETNFEKAGVKPINGTFRQDFEVTTGIELGERNFIAFGEIGIDAGPQWLPTAFSENGTAEGELCFVGYGITAPDLKYDDYEGINIKNKIAVILTSTPEGNSTESDFYAFSQLRYKATNARNHGASAVIFLPTITGEDHVPELEYASMVKNSGVIAAFASHEAFNQIVGENKIKFIEEEMLGSKKPASRDLGVKVKMEIDLRDVKEKTSNIIGVVEGTDPHLKNEYIIIGAHYDHLGMGGPTSLHKSGPAVHNGADDNASGTAGVIALGYKIAAKPMKRSVILMGFSAEEMGLLGSDYYVQNSQKEIKNAVAMFNMDMIGRLRENKLTLFGVGSSPLWEQVSDSLAKEVDIKIIENNEGYGPSDHSSFYKKDIPVLMFFSGTHGDYHSPNDDWDKINYPGMEKVLNLVYSYIETVSNKSDKPQFVEVKEADSKAKRGRHSYKSGAWFGIIPNFEETPLGCKISGASPGSPAMKAGLQENDIITTINGKEIKNLHDFMYTVREYKPGDVLDVIVLRGKDYTEKHEFKVKLARRVK